LRLLALRLDGQTTYNEGTIGLRHTPVYWCGGYLCQVCAACHDPPSSDTFNDMDDA
jgi:hypothetical protein